MIKLKTLLFENIESLAKSKGYTLGPVYHGTDSKKFNTFQKGREAVRMILFSQFKYKNHAFFFTEDPDDAKNYGRNIVTAYLKVSKRLLTIDEIVTSSRFDKTKSKEYNDLLYILEPLIERDSHGATIDLFLEKPFVSNERAKDGDDILYQAGSRGLFDWSIFDNEEVIKRIIEKHYDWAYAEERHDNAGKSVVIFHPNQIKLADVNTYDNSGNIIPPDQRFNKSSDDVRY